MDEDLKARVFHRRRASRNPYAYIEYLEDAGMQQRTTSMTASGEKIRASRRSAMYADEGADMGHGTGIQLIRNALSPKQESRRHDLAGIEAQANDLLRRMWRERDSLWEGEAPSDPLAIIDPAMALKVIGYDFSPEEDLGEYRSDRRGTRVAGVIDHVSRTVHVSKRFPSETRMFTAAHELGHAVLQHNMGGSIHRDRPLDGQFVQRDRIEFEADKFASYFLMPAKLVRQHFVESFGTDCFMLSEETAFVLSGRTLHEFQKACGSLRDLSRLLAKVGHYDGHYFSSLAKRFGVSTEAMAIRLEELGLIEPWLLEEG